MVLDMFPGISRPGRELGEGRYIRNTSCLGGLVTDDQAADRDAGHAPKSPRCTPWEVTDFAPSSGISPQVTARCLDCRIVDGWPYADIAVHLAVPRDVLADRVRRLRTDLRRKAKALGA